MPRPTDPEPTDFRPGESAFGGPGGRTGDGPGQSAWGALPATHGEEAGQWIDRYRLERPIGEGGMGVVWLAEQEQPVRRRVALKVIKLGMDTRDR